MKTSTGILTRQNGKSFLLDDDGSKHLQDDIIWDGYTMHWTGNRVCARSLTRLDYQNNKPIVLLWPNKGNDSSIPFFELYYNERLVRYPLSRLGHIAINVNNKVFNFSHLIVENEVMTPEEYLYRPALGEFSPHPVTGLFNKDDADHPYSDRFGRLFMRTIHVLRVEGIDTEYLSDYYNSIIREVHSTPTDPARPDKYAAFNIFNRSCTTIIRNGLQKACSSKISGIFPRDLFINAAYNLTREEKSTGAQKFLFLNGNN